MSTLSEITPACSPAVSPPSTSVPSTSSSGPSSSGPSASGPSASGTNAKSVDLAPVIIRPSHMLWRIELVFYFTLLVAACVGLFPFFLTAFYWPILWLVFSLLIIFVLRKAWRTKNSSPLTLSVRHNLWRLRSEAGEFTVVPCGEILLWSWVIILPLRNLAEGKKSYVVVLQDSMNDDDWRKLRVWLRTGMRNNI